MVSHSLSSGELRRRLGDACERALALSALDAGARALSALAEQRARELEDVRRAAPVSGRQGRRSASELSAALTASAGGPAAAADERPAGTPAAPRSQPADVSGLRARRVVTGLEEQFRGRLEALIGEVAVQAAAREQAHLSVPPASPLLSSTAQSERDAGGEDAGVGSNDSGAESDDGSISDSSGIGVSAAANEVAQVEALRTVSTMLQSSFARELDSLMHDMFEAHDGAALDPNATVLQPPGWFAGNPRRRGSLSEAPPQRSVQTGTAVALLADAGAQATPLRTGAGMGVGVGGRALNGEERELLSAGSVSQRVEQLARQVAEMSALLRLQMDMQTEMQRLLRQDVAAALPERNDNANATPPEELVRWEAVQAGTCAVCHTAGIDCLLYRCGHMVCGTCAVWAPKLRFCSFLSHSKLTTLCRSFPNTVHLHGLRAGHNAARGSAEAALPALPRAHSRGRASVWRAARGWRWRRRGPGCRRRLRGVVKPSYIQ